MNISLLTKLKKPFGLLSVILMAVLLLCSCSPTDATPVNNGTGGNDSVIAPTTDINNIAVTDKTSLYEKDDDTSVVTMFLTVRKGNDNDSTNHTWAEVNNYPTTYYTEQELDRYGVDGILQIGNEKGPQPGEFGYGLNVPNATVNVRGSTSSKAAQKSYKISIKSGAGEWNGQKTIALNKHPYDSSRFRNKLSYDLIKTIPNMLGLRTQFVRLYVKDQTVDNSSGAKYIDYGLYTQVEQVNTRYLRNHGLDEQGQLYKATMFEFFRYSDSIKPADDSSFRLDAFEQVLEVKGNENHTKLISMLNDLNNYSIPIEEVFKKYFDEENYFTWLAFQMLTGNTDTTSQNFYLYSPQNANKWYFISWDNDGAWTSGEEALMNNTTGYNYEKGVSNYWGSQLHRRMLKSKHLRAKLDQKVEYIKNLITSKQISQKVLEYQAVVEPYMYRMPDQMYVVYEKPEFQKIIKTFADEISTNYNFYKSSLEYPMPFYIDTIALEANQITFAWDTSFDFDDESLTYSIEISKDYTFKTTLAKKAGLKLAQYKISKLPAGQYFLRLTATNTSGKTGTAAEFYEDAEDNKYYGVRTFYVLPDGSIGG